MPEQYTIRALIAESEALLGVPSYVAAGAFYGLTAPITLSRAQSILASWLHQTVGLTPGVVTVGVFNFTFDTPEIVAGATAYKPTPGDLILGAWLEVPTPWNGTTPKLALAWSDPMGPAGENALPFQGQDMTLTQGAGLPVNSSASAGTITTSDPLTIAVTSDGSIGGPDPGASQGEANLYLMLSRNAIPLG